MQGFFKVAVIVMLSRSEASRYAQNETLRPAQGDITQTLKKPWCK
jgi:hypothetical protein